MRKTDKALTWLGHNCFLFEYGGVRFVTDPFLPKGSAPCAPEDVKADYVLVSHGHGDHIEDALMIARKNSATVVAIAEVAGKLARNGVKTEPVNIGGAIYIPVSNDPDAPKAQILAIPAPHSSTMPDGSSGGNSLGFLLSFPQNGSHLSPDLAEIKPMRDLLSEAFAFSIYFACDTGLFADMSWIGSLGLDVAVLPIGDRYTMGPSLSLEAISRLNPRYAVPCHYNTWPPLRQDTGKWSDAVRQYTQTQPLVMRPGQTVREDENSQWS